YFDQGVADVAAQQDILWIPGCTTPTEIHYAENAGFHFLKLFPGSLGGPSLVEAIKPVFPNVDFVVTGGVSATKENIDAWFRAGAAGVGLGSKLITKDILEKKQYDALALKTRELLQICARS